jgi:hypothetical protein
MVRHDVLSKISEMLVRDSRGEMAPPMIGGAAS